MKPSSCLHPVRIYNKALRSFINVPCGHCDACNVIKGYRRAEKINAAFNQFFYRYFVTLTYCDDCLPLAQYNDMTECLESDDCDYNGELYHVKVNSKECRLSKDFILDRVQKYGGVPVLSHRDCILFKKRLRKYLYEATGNYYPIFISCTGEYGPLHFRPHMHLLIAFNERSLASVFRECVSKAWSVIDKYHSSGYHGLIGKIDVQNVIGKGCTNYCAAYVNCVTSLPKVLQTGDFRQFQTKSRTSDFELLRKGSTDIKRIVSELPITETFVDSQTFKESTTLCSDLYKNRFFPRCAEFSRLSHCDRVALYGVAQRFYGLSAQEFAERMIDLRENGYFYIPTNIEVLLNFYFISADKFHSITKLKRLYYVSRRVLQNSFACGISLEQYVTQIERFYAKLELDKLRRFYRSVNDLMDDAFNPLPLSGVYSMYFNTDLPSSSLSYYQRQFGVVDDDSINDIAQQKEYAEKMHKICLDNTKTKKRNDDFEHRGISHRPYLITLSRSKQDFINFWRK